MQPAYDEDIGDDWAWFLLVAWWRANEVLGLREEQGSEQKCSLCPQGWNLINKSLFPSTLTVGSCTNVPCEQGHLLSYTPSDTCMFS